MRVSVINSLIVQITDAQKTTLNSNSPYIVYVIRTGVSHIEHSVDMSKMMTTPLYLYFTEVECRS